jgi:predicted helicase
MPTNPNKALYNYILRINALFQQGNATEHSYRGDLQYLIESLVPEIKATNEPKRQACGAPDYILTKKDIPVGFIEAKDVGDKDLEGKKKSVNKAQFDRYKASLNNLIFTDYIDFHLYHEGEFVTKIAIAEISEKGIVALPHHFEQFENLIQDFCTHIGQHIRSSKKLAEMMAGKARLLSDIIGKALLSDEINHENSSLKEQLEAFKQILIHDITPNEFADVYAQTIAYGMFAARLHDPTLENFSRQEAAELIPKSNPFLRKLFGYIAGPDIDDRIKWVVENLAEIFLACNVEELLKNYGKTTKTEDPIIHFYETFLSEYDPKLRKARGVWYTPQPVVRFIVNAVDEILKTEFDLPQGLADTSKVKINVNMQGKKVEQLTHRVQILDPATGTGTFLAETIRTIYAKFKGQQGIWSNYVEQHLLPRLNGFELLMASYAMAHLKLDLLLRETGFVPTRQQRTRVYLTNSLEESHPDTGTLFANWLSTEANEANHIKRDTPVMCVIGNPPYAVSSTNKSEWIEKLTADYKRDMIERNIQPLSDDYIKFIRYGQHYIEKNRSGVLAYISNNSFIDGIIHRQMRKHLLETFDKIYILDLHGNARKKEISPDGSPDQNVFDIMQGVSINLFVKNGKKKASELGKVLHYDLYGKRDYKYGFLNENFIKTINWEVLKNEEPYYFFINKDLNLFKNFSNGINLRELFIKNSMGVATGKDSELVDFTKHELENKFNISPTKFNYRPFDTRFTVFDNNILQRARYTLMSNYLLENIGLNVVRQSKQKGVEILVNKNISNRDLITNHTYNFPLYIYLEANSQTELGHPPKRVANLNLDILKKIENSFADYANAYNKLDGGQRLESIIYDSETETDLACYLEGYPREFGPLDLLDYIYAVLHSPRYREKYKEFLKIDFPRVPYPKDPYKFWRLVSLGGQLRKLHLLEAPEVENYITSYPKNGSNTITRKLTKTDIGYEPKNDTTGKVWINDEQFFDRVPKVAWEFYIGGYQPAQKWLKDRKGRTLSYDDILHYQKIIVALTKTHELMGKIDSIMAEKDNMEQLKKQKE